MITGRLTEVNGKYYAILNLKHPDGKRLQKRFDLELPVQNNKRRAQEKLNALCEEYTRKQQVEQNHPDVILIAIRKYFRLGVNGATVRVTPFSASPGIRESPR